MKLCSCSYQYYTVVIQELTFVTATVHYRCVAIGLPAGLGDDHLVGDAVKLGPQLTVLQCDGQSPFGRV